MLNFSANLSLLFTERPLAERFAAARAAGFRAVEIQFPYELSVPQLKALLTGNDLRLVLINVPAGDLMEGGDGLACVPGREKAFREAVALALEYATALEVPTVNVLAGRQAAGVSEEDCYSTLQGNLHHAVTAFRKAGIRVVTEAINIFDMPRFLVHSLADMQQLCEQVPGLGMQFDCYHMARMGEDVATALTSNLPLIGHVQFADAPGRHEPGSGSLDFLKIFSGLEASSYNGWCGAEYRPSQRTESTLAWLARWQQTS